MKSIVAALAAIAFSVASAKITSSRPGLNQVLVAGTTTQIVWAPAEGVISAIDLLQGDKLNLNFLETIATNVPANAGSYSWNIPATLPAGTDYALSFGQSPSVDYSPFFTIQAANGAAGNGSAPAPSSSVAASSSSSAAGTTVAPKPTSTASSTSTPSGGAKTSAPAPSSSESAANKNVAAVGALAVAGAVAAALI